MLTISSENVVGMVKSERKTPPFGSERRCFFAIKVGCTSEKQSILTAEVYAIGTEIGINTNIADYLDIQISIANVVVLSK